MRCSLSIEDAARIRIKLPTVVYHKRTTTNFATLRRCVGGEGCGRGNGILRCPLCRDGR